MKATPVSRHQKPHISHCVSYTTTTYPYTKIVVLVDFNEFSRHRNGLIASMCCGGLIGETMPDIL